MVPLPTKVPVLQPPAPAPAPTGQRMLLQSVKSGSGLQYYRGPNGQLYRLVPLSQLRPVNPNQLSPTGESVPLCHSAEDQGDQLWENVKT